MKLARTKEWRESRGLTQRALAAKAGVGGATVARIESGASVTPPTARKVADALGASVADLLERPPIPLAEASQEAGRLEKERLEADSPKDRQHWEEVLANVRERQREVEARVEELVALPDSSKDGLYQVKQVLDEAQDCWVTLMLALPGSYRRHRGERDVVGIDNLFAVDPDQWEKLGKAEGLYYDIAKRLAGVGLVELKERVGQRAEPVPVGIEA